MELTRVLIVEESHATREFLTELVQLLGFHAHPVRRKTEFLTHLHTLNPDLLLLGTCRNSAQLEAVVQVLHREKEGMPVVCISDSAEPIPAEKALALENSRWLPKTFNPSQLKLAIEELIEKARECAYGKLDHLIVGQSPGIMQIKKHILRLSKCDVAVLITGESGTGKELAARAIHDLSPRAKRPFIKVNSAAVPSTLLESELFGYEKGAFTGAWQRKPGKFALAHSGSILLDEIGEIPLHVQPKLLQVLQDGELSTLGSTTNTKIDVRVFASTNANLAEMVPRGSFRADLYYRMNVVNIHIPPLRERKEDLDVLCDHFLTKHTNSYGKNQDVPSKETRRLFYEYSWPGNVRELENMIQSMAVLGNADNFRERLAKNRAHVGAPGDDPPPNALHDAAYSDVKSPRTRALKEFCREAAQKAETDAILNVLIHTHWNRRKAAKILQISYKALLNRIKQYRIDEAYPGTFAEEVHPR
jgi:two-component system response regulator AtoC